MKCSRCGYEELKCDGWTRTLKGMRQRFQCKRCGKINFSPLMPYPPEVTEAIRAMAAQTERGDKQ